MRLLMTMRIGLISDTHIPEVVNRLPEEIYDLFSDVDLILHAGDIYAVSVLDDLERLAPVMAAEGDDDYDETWRDNRVKYRQILAVAGVVIWLVHVRPWSWPARVRPPDVLVFGHTHSEMVHKNENILLVNPGSATFPNYKYQAGTVGFLQICAGKVDVTIVPLRKNFYESPSL